MRSAFSFSLAFATKRIQGHLAHMGRIHKLPKVDTYRFRGKKLVKQLLGVTPLVLGVVTLPFLDVGSKGSFALLAYF